VPDCSTQLSGFASLRINKYIYIYIYIYTHIYCSRAPTCVSGLHPLATQVNLGFKSKANPMELNKNASNPEQAIPWTATSDTRPCQDLLGTCKRLLNSARVARSGAGGGSCLSEREQSAACSNTRRLQTPSLDAVPRRDAPGMTRWHSPVDCFR
jgi:hypothetical protein